MLLKNNIKKSSCSKSTSNEPEKHPYIIFDERPDTTLTAYFYLNAVRYSVALTNQSATTLLTGIHHLLGEFECLTKGKLKTAKNRNKVLRYTIANMPGIVLKFITNHIDYLKNKK